MSEESNISDNIASVFSILPEDMAKDAETELLRRYLEKKGHISEPVIWAEFDWQGGFLRGGESDIEGLSTRVFTEESQNADLSVLVEIAQSRECYAGYIESISDDKFIWFVPFTPSHNDANSQTRLKGFSIKEPVFRQILDAFNAQSKLTNAEKRVIFQLTSGKTLAAAAAEDGVSNETKRAQLKLVCSKLRCKGQTDLVRLALGQVVHLVTMTDSETADTQIVESFVAKYFHADVRLTVQRLPNGRLQRVFESGPIDGKPVIVLHGMLYPLVFNGARKHLESAGLRLIMPIRHGFLEARPVSELYHNTNLLDKTLEDLSLYIQHFCKAPACILGQSLGSILAIRFAKLYPNLISELILLSVNQAQAGTSTTEYNRRFYSGLKSILNKPGIFRFISWQFRKYYADEKNARTILRKMFERCEDDVKALDQELGGHPPYTWFKDSYKNSVVGIADDFSFAMNANNEELAELRCPLYFIQGRDDPMTPLEAIKSLASMSRAAKIIELGFGGHLTYASHPEKTWQAVASILH